MTVTTKTTRPADMLPKDMNAFIDFVGKAGEVDKATLPGLVKDAVALITIHDGETLIGTAAIKHPFAGYRARTFKKAGDEKQASAYPLELGWLHVHEGHRGQKHSRTLMQAAMTCVGDDGIYATTKNDAMRKVLPEFGFAHIGTDFASTLRRDEKLSLFTRAATKDG